MNTVEDAARTVKLEAEVVEANQLVAKQLAALPMVAWPKTPSAPRWRGVVVTRNDPISGLVAEVPGRWLAHRGIFLDLFHLGDPLDVTRLGMTPLRSPKWLFDAAASLQLPIFHHLHATGAQVFVTLEDNYWHPPAGAPEWLRGVMAKVGPALTRRLVQADGVIVATPFMAEVARRLKRNVMLIPWAPPALSELYQRPVREGRARRIGWAGTHLHVADLELLHVPILTWLAADPGAAFVLCGQAFPAWAEHPQIERHPGGQRLLSYYRWLASLDLDVFLVPLQDNEFNRGKAILKPLEAAALGLPTIVSNVPPYAGVLDEDTGAIMVQNTEAAWTAALDRLHNASLRTTLAARGIAWAGRNTIDATGPAWARLWGAA